MDEVLEAWRNRPLGEIVYIYLDARYEKVRMDGQIQDTAILMAAGVGMGGKRQILGISVSLSEAELHWRAFLESLVERGLRNVELIISDDHSGMRKARQAVFAGIPWQRCQFHLQQNASQYVPRKKMRREVAASRVQRSNQTICRSLPAADCGEVFQNCFCSGRLDGDSHTGRIDGL
jgi:transposase-like protein